LTFNDDVRETLRRGDGTVPNTVGGSYRVLTLTPEAGVRLPRGFSVRLRAPLHWKTFDETADGTHRVKNGLGDVEVLGGWDLSPAPRWRVHFTAGAALPTGEHTAQPFVGTVAPTPLQLGSGTFDPIVAASGSFRAPGGFLFDASAAGRVVVMENSDRYRPASLYELAIGGQWKVWPMCVGVLLHVDYSHVTHVEVAGALVSNTGRDAIYVEPGVTVRLWSTLTLEATARIPVYLRVNETQFTEDALFAARLVYRTPPLF
jgi:hypothetical protein